MGSALAAQPSLLSLSFFQGMQRLALGEPNLCLNPQTAASSPSRRFGQAKKQAESCRAHTGLFQRLPRAARKLGQAYQLETGLSAGRLHVVAGAGQLRWEGAPRGAAAAGGLAVAVGSDPACGHHPGLVAVPGPPLQATRMRVSKSRRQFLLFHVTPPCVKTLDSGRHRMHSKGLNHQSDIVVLQSRSKAS